MRRRLRLCHLPRACRCSMARDSGRAFADGGGHARFRLRRAAGLALVLPDQGDGGARRPGGAHARAAGLVWWIEVPKNMRRAHLGTSNSKTTLANFAIGTLAAAPLHISATSPISVQPQSSRRGNI